MKRQTKIWYWALLGLVILQSSHKVFSQEKVEKEYRIKQNKVPAVAVHWFKDAFEGYKKVKWYAEESSGKKSYEAKLKYKSYTYSVEFDTAGKVEDIERKVSFDMLPNAVQKNLNRYFDVHYQNYKIVKIQEQFRGAPDDLEDFIDEGENEGIIQFYEIEFYGKSDTENELWEGLFEQSGELIRKRKIILNPTNNLEF